MNFSLDFNDESGISKEEKSQEEIISLVEFGWS